MQAEACTKVAGAPAPVHAIVCNRGLVHTKGMLGVPDWTEGALHWMCWELLSGPTRGKYSAAVLCCALY